MKDKLADNKYTQEYDKAIKYIYDMMAQGKVGIGDKLPVDQKTTTAIPTYIIKSKEDESLVQLVLPIKTY